VQTKLLCLSPLLLSALALTSVADAQECTTDSECPADYRCNLPPSGTAVDCPPDECGTSGSGGGSSGSAVSGSSNGSDATPEVDAPPSTVASGVTEAREAPAAPDTPDTTAPTEPGGDVADPVPPVDGSVPPPAPVAVTGSCEPAPFECATDADCPAPSTCSTRGQCELSLTTCDTGAACGANYACTEVGRTSCGSTAPEGSPVDPDVATGPTDPAGNTSSGSADDSVGSDTDPASGAPVPAEEPLPTTPPDGEDDACEPQSVSMCFPEAIGCTDDDACPADWTCEDATKLDLPAFEGLDRACLPPGIAAFLAGHVDLDEETRGELGSTENDSEATSGIGGVPQVPDPVPGDPDEGAVSLGTQGGSEGASPSTGCSVSRAGHSGEPSGPVGTLAWPALLGLGLALWRRSPRSRVRSNSN
jgi:hypothetical protein